MAHLVDVYQVKLMSAITNLPRDRCGDGADPPRGEWFNFDFGAPLMHCRPIYEYYVEPHPTNQPSPSPNGGQAGLQLWPSACRLEPRQVRRVERRCGRCALAATRGPDFAKWCWCKWFDEGFLMAFRWCRRQRRWRWAAMDVSVMVAVASECLWLPLQWMQHIGCGSSSVFMQCPPMQASYHLLFSFDYLTYLLLYVTLSIGFRATAMNVLCCFSSPVNTSDSSPKGVCKSSYPKDCFMVCYKCAPRPVYQCLRCIEKLQKAIKQHTSRRDIIHCNYATEVVMSIDWSRVRRDHVIPKSTTRLDGVVRDVPITHDDSCPGLFRWDCPCPCCGDKQLPPPPPNPPILPGDVIIERLQVKHRKLNKQSYLLEATTSTVEVILVSNPPVYSFDTLKHRCFGPGDGSCHVFHSTNIPANVDWRVILIPTGHGELAAASTCALKDDIQVTADELVSYYKLVQDSIPSPFNKDLDNDTLTTKQKDRISNQRRRQRKSTKVHGGRRNSYLRNCRTNGAAGLANGLYLADIKAAQTSKSLVRAPPRRGEYCVQIATGDETGLISKVPTFYAAALSNNFTKNPMQSMAMRSCEATGEQVLRAILDTPQHEGRDRLIRIHEDFAGKKVDAAYLLRGIECHTFISSRGYTSISSEAKSNIIDVYETAMNIARESDAISICSDDSLDDCDIFDYHMR